jgi:Phage tail lysozyme
MGMLGTTPAEAANWGQIDPGQGMRYVMELLVKNYQYPENGAAGIVGNLWAESDELPNRVEGSSQSAPMRAPDFTGEMTKFIAEQVMNRNRSAQQGPRLPGIGLAQWSSPSRRAGLINHTFQGRKLGANILYDMDAQVDYLVTKLQTQYRNVDNTLRRANVSLEEAGDEVVYNYEVPGSILGSPDPNGRCPKLPRNHSSVIEVFQRRRSFSRNALRSLSTTHPQLSWCAGIGY